MLSASCMYCTLTYRYIVLSPSVVEKRPSSIQAALFHSDLEVAGLCGGAPDMSRDSEFMASAAGKRQSPWPEVLWMETMWLHGWVNPCLSFHNLSISLERIFKGNLDQPGQQGTCNQKLRIIQTSGEDTRPLNSSSPRVSSCCQVGLPESSDHPSLLRGLGWSQFINRPRESAGQPKIWVVTPWLLQWHVDSSGFLVCNYLRFWPFTSLAACTLVAHVCMNLQSSLIHNLVAP